MDESRFGVDVVDMKSATASRRDLLRQMMRIRLVEERLAERYPEQEMRCPVHVSIGQEAVAVGACAALELRDYIVSTHRGHAHYLAKGGNLRAMLAEIYGKEAGCARGKGGSMHLIDPAVNMLGCTPIVGSSLPVAVGAAFGSRMAREDRVTLAFFGEAATEQGVFLESINFAALKRLPVIFVCENNLYSVYSPMAVRQPETRDRVALARASGLYADREDGNDVDAVFQLVTPAVQRARAGLGPSFLEFATYRWREHCGPHWDNHIGYRTEEEFQAWRRKCPIESYRMRLMLESEIDDGWVDALWRTLEVEVEAAFSFAKAAPFPEPESMLSQVYATEVPR